MFKSRYSNSIPVILLTIIYFILLLFSINHIYFWDNIQQTSKEAHWFFQNNFSTLLLPDFSTNSEIMGTGYHPPLTGLITAVLWKIFGLNLWVSHVFIFIVSLIMIYNTNELAKLLFPLKVAPWFTFLALMDATVMTQVSIASPDIILLASTVVALRAVVANKKLLLTVALIFLGLVNGRGMLACAIIFVFYFIYSFYETKGKFSKVFLIQRLTPFMPVFILLMAYFGYYFSQRTWFFDSNNKFPGANGWEKPDTLFLVAKNVVSYMIRILENGRIFVYLTFVVIFLGNYFGKKIKPNFSIFEKSSFVAACCFFALYLYFAITTKNVISSRYYMPLNFVGFLFIFSVLQRTISYKKLRITIAFLISMLILGNFWIYPEKRTNFWDGTLAHFSFYEIRDESLSYLEKNNIDLKEVSSGFCLYDNQRFIDLKQSNRVISRDVNKNTVYFMYSNISNLSDEFIDELNDQKKWKNVHEFRKGFVFIKLLKKIN